jgi:hypothetical protein
MSPRSTIPAILAVLLVATACTNQSVGGGTNGASPSPEPSVPSTEPPLATGLAARLACSIPTQWLLRIWRGYDPERSADVQILPRVPNFVGAGLPHVGPWDFTSDVPMFWYGPGHIKPIGPVQKPVTSADITATFANLLGSDFQAPDGAPMLDGLVPVEDRGEPPRLIVMMIWDGAGRDVLDKWPEAWPNLADLRPEGAWYENAVVGSSPTSSAQIHATLGTGAFPRHHEVVGHSIRIDGQIVSPWKDGPKELTLPTFADHYDAEMTNQPLIGLAGTVPIQLGMMSHGAYLEGGDNDLAVLRVPGNATTLGAEGVLWNLPEGWEQWYSYPPYANDLPPLDTYFDDVRLDERDGQRDGAWRGHPFEDSEELLDGFHTPARIPYQTRLVEEIISREGFGADDTPDLMFVNFKLIDTLGHLFGIQDPTMGDAVAVQDEELGSFVDFLDRQVGENQWVVLVTADHGSLESAETTGAFQISSERLHQAIEDEFDADGDDVPVIEQVKQTEIFMNVPELEEQGRTLEEVSEFIMELRQEQLSIPGLPVPDPSGKVFQVAFPARVLTQRLPCLPQSGTP